MFRNKRDEEKIYKLLGYRFKNKRLLLKALTRQSGIQEGYQSYDIGNFQQLEFIGDKVLNLVVSDILLENNPEWQEGKLTQEAANFINNKGPLAIIAKRWNLGQFLIMGYGEEIHNNARENTKVLSDAVEALIGAIWIDSENDYSFIKRLISRQFKAIGLIDFNQEYEDLIIKTAITAMTNDIFNELLPYWGDANDRETYKSLEQIRRERMVKKNATKPLSDWALSLKNVLDATDNEFEYDNENIINEPNTIKVEKTTNNTNHAAFFSQNKDNSGEVNHEVMIQENILNNNNTKTSE